MGDKVLINLEIDAKGPFKTGTHTAVVNAQVKLEDGRIGRGQALPQHRSQTKPYTGEDILAAIDKAVEDATSGPLPATVDSYTRYEPDSIDYGKGPDAAFATMEENWEQLKLIDKAQRDKGQLLGRYITHPIADGQAVYQITNVNGGQVTIQVCRGLGDDWVLPAWGEKATINRSTAEELVNRRDGLAALFASRRA